MPVKKRITKLMLVGVNNKMNSNGNDVKITKLQIFAGVVSLIAIFITVYNQRFELRNFPKLASDDSKAISDNQSSNENFVIPFKNINKIDVGKEFTSDASITSFDKDTKITSLGLSAEVKYSSASSSVRVTLIDQNNYEHQVYEGYPLLSGSKKVYITNFCNETCLLEEIRPVNIKIETFNDASIKINSLVYSTDYSVLSENLDQNSYNEYLSNKKANLKIDQDMYIIKVLNEQIKQNNLRWVAGETNVSKKYYQFKKKMFGSLDDNLVVDYTTKGPLLIGKEYYKSGTYEVDIPESKVSTAGTTSSLPQKFTWQRVHGQDWNTVVKDQGNAGTCTRFAAVGTIEAQINLYYNQHINPDLSEQMLVDCSMASSEISELVPRKDCKYCYPGEIYCNGGYSGIVDEACDPYVARDFVQYYCNSKNICSDWKSRIWKNTTQMSYYLGSITGSVLCKDKKEGLLAEDLKRLLIEKGPLYGGLDSWSHAMEIVGYETDSVDGAPIWIFKNSWGYSSSDEGYIKVKTDVQDLKYGSIPFGPYTPPSGKSYKIACTDDDKDNYCNWGISSNKPDTCSSSCKVEKDCDDSNPNFTTYDTNLNCVGDPIKYKAGEITSPFNYQKMASTDITIKWNKGGSEVSNYTVKAGKNRGESNYYEKTGISSNDSSLLMHYAVPENSGDFYVRLITDFKNNTFAFNDYVYTAYTVASNLFLKSDITSPDPYSLDKIPSYSIFRWTKGQNISSRRILVGSKSGDFDIYKKEDISFDTLSQAIDFNDSSQVISKYIPTSGVVYVELWSKNSITNTYEKVSYKYTINMSNTVVNKASNITEPTSNVLTSTSQKFSWDSGNNISNYTFKVGKTDSGSEYYNGSNLSSSSTNVTVSNLPKDGSTLYVSLVSNFKSGTTLSETKKYQYTAYKEVQVIDQISPVVSIVTPTSNSELTGSSVITTTATDNIGVVNHQILIDNTGNPIYILKDCGAVFSCNVSLDIDKLDLKTDERPDYFVIVVEAKDAAGNMGRKYIEVKAKKATTIEKTISTIKSPLNNSTIQVPYAFTWENTNADEYHLYLGSGLGLKDYYTKRYTKGTITDTVTSMLKAVPSDSTIYVRLWSNIGTWVYNDYTYKNYVEKSTLEITATSTTSIVGSDPILKIYVNKKDTGIITKITSTEVTKTILLPQKITKTDLLSIVFDNDTCKTINDVGVCTDKIYTADRNVSIKKIRLDNQTLYAKTPTADDTSQIQLFNVMYDRSNKEDNSRYDINQDWGNILDGFWDNKVETPRFSPAYVWWDGAVNISLK